MEQEEILWHFDVHLKFYRDTTIFDLDLKSLRILTRII